MANTQSSLASMANAAASRITVAALDELQSAFYAAENPRHSGILAIHPVAASGNFPEATEDIKLHGGRSTGN
jgi:hypothetical protein